MAEDIELSNRLVKAGTKFSFYRPFVLLLARRLHEIGRMKMLYYWARVTLIVLYRQTAQTKQAKTTPSVLTKRALKLKLRKNGKVVRVKDLNSLVRYQL